MRAIGCERRFLDMRCRPTDGGAAARSHWNTLEHSPRMEHPMIRKLATGQYRLYSRKVDAKTGKRRNLGTFETLEAAQKHEREVQYFKRRG
jgi:hypothetical protein